MIATTEQHRIRQFPVQTFSNSSPWKSKSSNPSILKEHRERREFAAFTENSGNIDFASSNHFDMPYTSNR